VSETHDPGSIRARLLAAALELEAVCLAAPKRTFDCDDVTTEWLTGLLREAAAALSPQPPWQPIETAPKDARTLIGYGLKLPERWVRVGLGTYFQGDWMWHEDVPWAPATHWMPLVCPEREGSVLSPSSPRTQEEHDDGSTRSERSMDLPTSVSTRPPADAVES
jgi:hypothetical protein